MNYRLTPPKVCKVCGQLYIRKLGQESVKKFSARVVCGYSCGGKMNIDRSKASDRIKIRNANQSGEKNPNWRGGRTLEARLFRKSNQYKVWRKAVLDRDKRMCVLCGDTEKLEVDHIEPFAVAKNRRLDIDNGRVLCKSCHVKTPSYGRNLQCV